MSTFIFLRHAHSAANREGRLTGQLPGIGLSTEGHKQSLALIERIGKAEIDHIRISPIERCSLTIEPWLRSKNSQNISSLSFEDGFSEIDFGKWSGRKLSSLRRERLWRDIQERPSTVTFPQGESFRGVQRRAMTALDALAEQRGDKSYLVVSHSDTIKLLLAKVLGMKLDNFQSLEVAPASFSIITNDRISYRVVTMNNSGSLKELLPQ